MRHLLANILTYAIAALLVIGAMVFAWLRSSQVVLTDEVTLLQRFESTPGHEFEWQTLGAGSYVRNCANCHGREGRGWDEYPGLQHVALLAAQERGREYLIDVHLYGLTSSRWGAPMPPMRHMHDVELAAVLNHVLSRFSPGTPPTEMLYVPADVAARRGLNDSPAAVNRRRPLE